MQNIIDYVNELAAGLFGKEDSVLSAFYGLFGSLGNILAQVVPFVGIALCFLLTFFGKKWMPFFKPVGFFIAGFFASMYWLIPVLNGIEFFAKLPEFVGYIVAGLIAIVAAVFSKFLYIIAYAGVFGGGVFFAVWGGLLVTKVANIVVKGNWIIGAAAGVVVAALAFLLRKFIEKVGSAFIGATCLFLIVRSTFDVVWDVYANAWINAGGFQLNIKWVIIGVLTLLGIIFQMITNRKKKV